MKYLGIDFGIKRVGLAVSDPQGKMAFPLKTIHRSSREKLFEELISTIERERIQAIVLGLPRSPHGENSLTCRQVLNFRQSLERRTNVPVFTVNEALTSYEGQKILESRKKRTARRDGQLDQVAATLILESFLEKKHSVDKADEP